MKIEGKYRRVCPYLNEEARCSVYPMKRDSIEVRPRVCQTFECLKIIYGLEAKLTAEEMDRAVEGLKRKR